MSKLLDLFDVLLARVFGGPMPSPLPTAPFIRPGKMLTEGTAGLVEWEYWSDGVHALRVPVAGWFGGTIGLTIEELETALAALKQERLIFGHEEVLK